MVRTRFNPHLIKFDDFFKKDPQKGNGYYFRGFPYQRGYGMQGHGLGGVLSYLARFLVPILKSAGKEVGKEALTTGAHILGNILKGDKSHVLSESREGAHRLLKRVNQKYDPQYGNGMLIKKRRKQVVEKQKSKKKNMFAKLHAAKKPRNTMGLF